MQSTLLHVLLIESGLNLDAVVTAGLLVQNPLVHIEVSKASSIEEGLANLRTGGIDVALIDLGSSRITATANLQRLQAESPATPIVALIDDPESEMAVEAIRLGAQDLIPKTAISGSILTRALLFATVRQRRLHRLRIAADHDQLTSLPNRRCFIEAFHDIDRTQSNALALIDVDHFRDLNSQFGHIGGDNALRHLGQLLARELANDAQVFRYGGEEFAVLLESPIDQVIERLDRLVETVASASLEVNAKPLSMTISAGLTPVASDDTYLQAMQRCDRALYDAKARGRNRVVVAENPAKYRSAFIRFNSKRDETCFAATEPLPQG